MNEMDPLEQRLKGQPLLRAPIGWREEILSAAREAKPPSQPASAMEDSIFSLLNRRLRSLLWPHPAAWGGLAAIWIFIFAVNVSQRDNTRGMARTTPPPSPEAVAELKQQQRFMAELMGQSDARDADRPKVFVPAPRSESVELLRV